MTYEMYFSLSRRPFSVHPDPTSYFALPRHQQMLTTLRDCAEHVEGIGLLVGDAGLGKTLLCRLLVQELAPRLQGIVLTHSNLASKRALLQAILFELRQPYAGMDEQESRLALLHHLQSRPEMHAALLLVVDEAHGLEPGLLEELRLITNWTFGVKPLVRLVLAGQPILEELLAGPETDLLNRRIARRAYLSPLAEDETTRYIVHRLRWAGADAGSIFTAEALSAIHRCADGVPRTINLLCDQVLALAAERRMAPVTAAAVQEAWGVLEQVPTTWDRIGTSPNEASHAAAGVVEFGSTDDPTESVGRDAAFAEATARDEDADHFGLPGGVAPESDPTVGHTQQPDESDVIASFCGIGEATSLESPERSVPARTAPLTTPPQLDPCGTGDWVFPQQGASWQDESVPTAQQPPEPFSPSPPTLAEGEVVRAAATLREVVPEGTAPETLENPDWQVDPSPLDAPFEQEEQVWDQYASLDAQTSPESPLSTDFTLHFAPREIEADNGAAKWAGKTTRRSPNSSASPRTSARDYRRLFSRLRE